MAVASALEYAFDVDDLEVKLSPAVDLADLADRSLPRIKKSLANEMLEQQEVSFVLLC